MTDAGLATPVTEISRSPAFVDTVMVPDEAASTVGVNVTLNVAVAPGATVVPLRPLTVNRPLSDEMDVIVSASEPVFVMVTVSVAESPWKTSPKAIAIGSTTRSGSPVTVSTTSMTVIGRTGSLEAIDRSEV